MNLRRPSLSLHSSNPWKFGIGPGPNWLMYLQGFKWWVQEISNPSISPLFLKFLLPTKWFCLHYICLSNHLFLQQNIVWNKISECQRLFCLSFGNWPAPTHRVSLQKQTKANWDLTSCYHMLTPLRPYSTEAKNSWMIGHL